MATKIFQTPHAVEGCVVECGSYKGGSTANLSLACALTGRQLEVFDSFQGLPVPVGGDDAHYVLTKAELHTYEHGAWTGTLEEVRRNIMAYGNIACCHFHAGYFEHTLPLFQEKCALAFIDVDLVDSIKTCIRYLWPRLQPGSYVFVHEAHHSEVANLFFDNKWWKTNLNCPAPGLIGAGTGLGLSPAIGGFKSSLGYAIKDYKVMKFATVPQDGLHSQTRGV